MPVRNERATIDAAVGSALAQDGPSVEVIVADGMSDDGTREALHRIASADRRVRVIDNPGQTTSRALNAGLARARGKYWVRLDGHSIWPPRYVEGLVSHIGSRRCDAAGAVVRGRGDSAFGRAVAAAHDSRFGMGNARQHYASRISYIDHVSHGAYRVDITREIGGFDEGLVRNQDYDFDYRYRQTGARILIDPNVTFERRVRETPAALARQYYEYGYWKYRVLRRHPASLHWRWLAPPSLVFTLATGLFLAWTRPGRRLLGVTAASYGSVLALGAAVLGRRTGRRIAARIPLGLATMHLAWGAGFLHALVRHR